MKYARALQWMFRRLPMYSRVERSAYRPGLDNIRKLCAHLGNPHNDIVTIHIAGTNGKGSVSSMLASILTEAGYRTGLYTSPHLRDFRERIRINGQKIPRRAVSRFVQSNQTFIESLDASFFEVTAALAFHHFAKKKVDVAVIETGLGGKLDSTNIIQPVLSIITNISWDHKNVLGDTLEQIATQKAGIIKPGVPVVVGERNQLESVNQVFTQTAQSSKSPLVYAEDHWVVHFEKWRPDRGICQVVAQRGQDKLPFQSPLCGAYQAKNIATVLTAVEQLRALGFSISKKNVRRGFRHVIEHSGLAGRWQLIGKKPLVIADVAHNESGLQYTIAMLRSLDRPVHFVVGFVADKDLESMLKLFPKDAQYYFCCPPVPRGLPVDLLKEVATRHGLTGQAYNSVRKALKAAVRHCKPKDVVYVGGSTFVVAEVV